MNSLKDMTAAEAFRQGLPLPEGTAELGVWHRTPESPLLVHINHSIGNSGLTPNEVIDIILNHRD